MNILICLTLIVGTTIAGRGNPDGINAVVLRGTADCEWMDNPETGVENLCCGDLPLLDITYVYRTYHANYSKHCID